jgi:hypothetical protein
MHGSFDLAHVRYPKRIAPNVRNPKRIACDNGRWAATHELRTLHEQVALKASSCKGYARTNMG